MNTSASRLIFILGMIYFLISCKVMEQANEMRTFAKCEFRVKNLEEVYLAGVDVTYVDQFSDLDFSQATTISMQAMKGKMPLNFKLNVEVRNPNDEKASMNRFLWDLYIDDELITKGKVVKDLKVPAGGGIAVLPVQVDLDLFDVLSGESSDAVLNFAMNLAGDGAYPSRVKLRVKPTIYIAMTEVKYPGFFTIEEEFVSE